MIKKVSIVITVFLISIIISIGYNWLTGNAGLFYSPVLRYFDIKGKENLNSKNSIIIETKKIPYPLYKEIVKVNNSKDSLKIKNFSDEIINLSNNLFIKNTNFTPPWGNNFNFFGCYKYGYNSDRIFIDDKYFIDIKNIGLTYIYKDSLYIIGKNFGDSIEVKKL